MIIDNTVNTNVDTQTQRTPITWWLKRLLDLENGVQIRSHFTEGVLYIAGTANPSRTPDFTPGFLGGIRVAHHFRFLLCCPIMCRYVLSCVLLYPFEFPHENDVRFVFTSSCLFVRALFTLFVFVCVYCVVFFCFVCLLLVLCIPTVASFSGLSIFDCTFGIL